MVDLIVAEKPSQATTIAKVLGKRAKLLRKRPVPVYYIITDRGEAYVTSVRGHVFDLDFIDSIRKKPRTKVDPLKLLISAPVKKYVRPGAQAIVNIIKKLAKKADRLIIATDYDREGENIGRQIVRIAKSVNPKIEVKRARFSSMTPREIREAFKNLYDLNMNLVNASEARQESDLRMGVALTRLMSIPVQRALGASKKTVVSLGPVQTPTLGFVVERYLKHLESKKKAKKAYVIVAETPYGEFTLEGLKRESRQEAEKYIRALPKELELLKVEKKESKRHRPLPLNTPRLAEVAAKYLGFSAKHTLSVAESLYLKGYISYPRTETDKRKPDSLSKAKQIVEEVHKLFRPSRRPGKPRSGRRDDQAHPPIHPVKVVHPGRLAGDERKLYELILRHFLANFGPDARMVSYKIVLTDRKHKFKREFQQALEPGRLEVYIYEKYEPYKELKIPKKVPVKRYKVREVPPKIVPPITEAELVKLMDKHGIGTDATFAEHIAKLIERGYVERKGKYLVPTELGLKIYEIVAKSNPELVKPDVRAFMERTFKLVEMGKYTKEQAVKVNLEKSIEALKKLSEGLKEHVKELVELKVEQLEKKKSRRRKKRCALFMRSILCPSPRSPRML